MGILRDISHEKEQEQQIKVLDRVLRHNLRNKMNIVMGYAQDLQASLADDEKEKAGRIVETVKTLLGHAEKARKIDEVLVEKETSLRRTDIAEVLESEVSSLRDDSQGVEVLSEIPDSVTVYAIESVDAAFREILENAVEHNDSSEPRVEVGVEKHDNRAVVTVSDNGSGIPQDEIDVVTGEKEIDPVSHASGLGLWIANWVVERSDGSIEFDVTDEGTTVEVWLRKPTESSGSTR
ncbi:MAG: HAMP domain-containing sensor histidine kinase [Halobacteria archaeon]|nr:HAMP domain-containing sensor histidine kinase [Halobacteria archaeon]